MADDVKRERLIRELARHRAACVAAESMMRSARQSIDAQQAVIAAGREQLRECRARIRVIRAELRERD